MIGNHQIGDHAAGLQLIQGDAHRTGEVRVLQIAVLLKHHDVHNLADIAVQETLALFNLKDLGTRGTGRRGQHRINWEEARRVTGRKQDTGAGAHRITEDTGVLLQGADALLRTDRVLAVCVGAVGVQTGAANHHLKHRVVVPIAGPLHAKLEVLVAVKETLNMVQVVFAGGCHLAGNAGGVQVSGEFIAAHGEGHESSFGELVEVEKSRVM